MEAYLGIETICFTFFSIFIVRLSSCCLDRLLSYNSSCALCVILFQQRQPFRGLILLTIIIVLPKKRTQEIKTPKTTPPKANSKAHEHRPFEPNYCTNKQTNINRLMEKVSSVATHSARGGGVSLKGTRVS